MSLREEIASLKTVAQDYAARFKRIDNVVWPKGMRIAVNFTAEFDAMLLRRPHNEPPMQLAKGEFGDRVVRVARASACGTTGGVCGAARPGEKL